jgi:hypothetical protein
MFALRLELKVCEGCGGLWVRRQGRSNPYCVGCSERLMDFPKRSRRPKSAVRRCSGKSSEPLMERQLAIEVQQ